MTAKIASSLVSPLNPCVGDIVEMRLTVNLPQGAVLREKDKAQGAINDAAVKNNNALSRPVTVTDIRIDNAIEGGKDGEEGGTSTLHLTIHLIPWQTGSVQLDTFDLSGGIKYDNGEEGEPFLLSPPPVTVMSVFPNGVQGEELCPPIGPILPPFTAHFLYATIAFTLIIIALLCMAAAQRRRIKSWIDLKVLEVKERRNVKMLRKRLMSLTRNAEANNNDAFFCTELQQAVRTYLAKRFGEDFAPLTTGEAAAVCLSHTEGIITREKEEAYDTLENVMRRTDYVRFSKNVLESGERVRLITLVLDAANVIESKSSS